MFPQHHVCAGSLLTYHLSPPVWLLVYILTPLNLFGWETRYQFFRALAYLHMHITILNREFLLEQKRQEYDMCVFPFVHWLGKSKSMLYYLGKKKGRTVVVGAEESFTYTKRKEKVGCIHIQKRRE